jgi:hypothetical protein
MKMRHPDVAEEVALITEDGEEFIWVDGERATGPGARGGRAGLGMAAC